MGMGKIRFLEHDNNGVLMDDYYCISTALQSEISQKPLPAVVTVSGGPCSRCTDGFDAPMAATLSPYLMSKDYFVLRPDYRSGSSRAHKYAYVVNGHADISYTDVAWLVKKGIEEGRVDMGRVAVTGFSQGEHIAYTAVTRSSPLPSRHRARSLRWRYIPRHTHISPPLVWERKHFLHMLARVRRFFAKQLLGR